MLAVGGGGKLAVATTSKCKKILVVTATCWLSLIQDGKINRSA